MANGGQPDDGTWQPTLHIKDLIDMVTMELMASQWERERHGLERLFKTQGLTLEVHFVAERRTEASGGLDLKVVTVGGKRTYQDQQIHKITLTLGVDEGGDAPGRYPNMA
jgi:hypothetical protein